jgi:hypothetical protein
MKFRLFCCTEAARGPGRQMVVHLAERLGLTTEVCRATVEAASGLRPAGEVGQVMAAQVSAVGGDGTLKR